MAEAEPAGRCISQFFEHLGFDVIEWYILSEFILPHPELVPWMAGVNEKGRMGNIKGKPNAEDLLKVSRDAKLLAGKI
jgi:hypothetical protein